MFEPMRIYSNLVNQMLQAQVDLVNWYRGWFDATTQAQEQQMKEWESRAMHERELERHKEQPRAAPVKP